MLGNTANLTTDVYCCNRSGGDGTSFTVSFMFRSLLFYSRERVSANHCKRCNDWEMLAEGHGNEVMFISCQIYRISAFKLKPD